MSAPMQWIEEWIEDIVEIIDADEKLNPDNCLDPDDVFEGIGDLAKEILIRNPEMEPRDAFKASARFFSYTYAAADYFNKAIEEIDNEDEDEDEDTDD